MNITSRTFKAFVGTTALLLLSLVTVNHAFAQICVPPPSGLVSWWPGEGDAKDFVGSNNGTLKGNAGFATGFVNQAFSFDGAGSPADHVEVLSSASLNITGPLTIDAWVFPTSNSGTRRIIIKDSAIASIEQRPYQFHTGGGRLLFCAGDGSVGFCVVTSPSLTLTLNTWSHVAAVYDGNDLILYINGAEAARQSVVLGPLMPGYFQPATAVLDA